MKTIFVGVSGWTYPPWRKTFYPEKLVQKKELSYASRKFSSLEINGTFYSLQKPKSFENWFKETPDDFVFSLKAPRFMTHILRLKECREPLATFLASGLLCLNKKLGPILWQLPPFSSFQKERIEEFFKLLPHTSFEAAELAKEHHPRIKDRAFFDVQDEFTLRHALEARHESFKDNPEFFELARRYRVAVVLGDSSVKYPFIDEDTCDFRYVRMHGEGKESEKHYCPKALDSLLEHAKTWSKKQDVFIYFNNDSKLNAPHDALRALKLLGQTKDEPFR